MRRILEEVVDVFDEPGPQLQEETLDVIQPIPAERISVDEAPELKHAPHGSCNWCSGNLVRSAQESTTSWTVHERSGRYDKVTSAEVHDVGSEVQQTVEAPPCQYIDRSVDIPEEMQRQTLGTHRKLIAQHAWQLALVWPWVSLRRRVTCLSSLIMAQGTRVFKHLRRATTLEDASEFDLSEEALGSPMDCVEDPSLFDLTKAMVDPELNAEFSLCGDLSSGVRWRASVFKATACEC